MREWVKTFLEEIDRLEDFYVKKSNEYSQEYEALKEKYIRKEQDFDE
jgi:hypothetical protein